MMHGDESRQPSAISGQQDCGLGTLENPIQLTKENIVDVLNDCRRMLDEQDVPPGIWVDWMDKDGNVWHSDGVRHELISTNKRRRQRVK